MAGGSGFDPLVLGIVVAFPIVFGAFWLAVTTLLGWLSGWFELQDLYPDRNEIPKSSLFRQTGQLGSGSPLNPFGTVSYSRCLRLDVCPGGLRMTVPKILGYHNRPVFVPWGEITVTSRRFAFWASRSLQLGPRSGRSLSISRKCYDQIAQQSPLPDQPA